MLLLLYRNYLNVLNATLRRLMMFRQVMLSFAMRAEVTLLETLKYS